MKWGRWLAGLWNTCTSRQSDVSSLLSLWYDLLRDNQCVVVTTKYKYGLNYTLYHYVTDLQNLKICYLF